MRRACCSAGPLARNVARLSWPHHLHLPTWRLRVLLLLLVLVLLVLLLILLLLLLLVLLLPLQVQFLLLLLLRRQGLQDLPPIYLNELR